MTRSAFGFLCGVAFCLGVVAPLSQRRPRVIESEWGPCRAPGTKEKMYVDIIYQNEYGFDHIKEEQQQPQLN
jgi:hypothetical protein